MAIKDDSVKPKPPDSLQDDSKPNTHIQTIPVSETNPAKSPTNDRSELNPPVDNRNPEFPRAQIDSPKLPEEETILVVPQDFMPQMAIILKDSGADSKSQEKALARIGEIIQPRRSVKMPEQGVKINELPTEQAPSKTSKSPINRPSEVPDLSKTE
jgi:hypothetical protein